MQRLFYLAAIALLAACGPADRASTRASGTDRGSVMRCGSAMPRNLAVDSIALRCAEGFVARNGYTDSIVEDTTHLSHEFIEVGRTAKAVLQYRRGSLTSHGVLLCHDRRDTPGFTVGFAAPGDTAMKVGRAVTMDTAFGQLKIEHEGFLLGVAATMPRCAWLGRRALAR
jgi:hypothetical protein